MQKSTVSDNKTHPGDDKLYPLSIFQWTWAKQNLQAIWLQYGKTLDKNHAEFWAFAIEKKKKDKNTSINPFGIQSVF